MKKEPVKVDNVRIKDLMLLLTKLSMHYDAVDIIVDPEHRRIILDPIIPAPPTKDIVLTDENIEDLI